MKKTLLILALMNCFFAFGQSDPQINELLQRLEGLPSTNLSFDQALEYHFNEVEQLLLMEYFENERAVNTQTDFPTVNRAFQDFFYVNDTRTARTFGTLSDTTPYVFTAIQSQPNYVLTAGDYDGSGNMYALDQPGFDLGSLLQIDTETGAYTTVGPLVGKIDGDLTYGMSWNEADQTMYVISGNLGASVTQLYSVDLATGALTTIGDTVENAGGGWLAIDASGNAFTVDLDNDSLYAMDLSTGLTSLIGPLGIDINFLQDASFDHATNTLYMAGYMGSGVGGIYTVDTTTGATTFLGSTTPLNVELGLFVVNPNPVLSIEGNNAQLEIELFPNPSSGIVEFKGSGVEFLQDIFIYDLQGRLISNPKSENGKIDISSFQSGGYIFKLIGDDGIITKRIIKN